MSHQVKALEAELAIKLFNRERQRLHHHRGRPRLSDCRARRARPHCHRHRAAVAAAERRRAHRSAPRRTSPPNGWCTGSAILPRRMPASTSRVSATLHHVDFAREEVDLAVRHGDGNWPGLDTRRLECRNSCLPCAVQSCCPARRRLGKPADILQISADPHGQPGRLDRTGCRGRSSTTPPSCTVRCSTAASMVIDAAINGQGIALARTTLGCLGSHQRAVGAAFPGIAAPPRPIGSFARRRRRACRRS